MTSVKLAVNQFERQPPDNMRKSNFFNFMISIFDGNNHPVEVQKAVFKDFCDSYSVSYPGSNIITLVTPFRMYIQ